LKVTWNCLGNRKWLRTAWENESDLWGWLRTVFCLLLI